MSKACRLVTILQSGFRRSQTLSRTEISAVCYHSSKC